MTRTRCCKPRCGRKVKNGQSYCNACRRVYMRVYRSKQIARAKQVQQG